MNLQGSKGARERGEREREGEREVEREVERGKKKGKRRRRGTAASYNTALQGMGSRNTNVPGRMEEAERERGIGRERDW